MAGVARAGERAAVAVLTYFHIVVGEMVPKSLALQRAEQMVVWITPPMLWTKNVLFPFVSTELAWQPRVAQAMGVVGRCSTRSGPTRPRSSN